MECRTCGDDFDPAEKPRSAGGFIDQCALCSNRSRDSQTKYLGRPGLTNKDGSVEVYRTNLKFVRAVLNRERSTGFGASLGLATEGEWSSKPISGEWKEEDK